jgi:endonuclease/exonuclease/phosphatase family metal-dependent hydrolase
VLYHCSKCAHHQVRIKVMSKKTVFTRNWSRFLNNFPKYHMKILLGDFNVKVGRENTRIFKPTIGTESLHQDSNDNRVRMVNFGTSNNLIVNSTMFLHRNIRKYNLSSPDCKIHNQIDNILINRRWHWRILNVRSFRGADCDTDHYLLVAKVREKLSVSKELAQTFNLRD